MRKYHPSWKWKCKKKVVLTFFTMFHIQVFLSYRYLNYHKNCYKIHQVFTIMDFTVAGLMVLEVGDQQPVPVKQQPFSIVIEKKKCHCWNPCRCSATLQLFYDELACLSSLFGDTKELYNGGSLCSSSTSCLLRQACNLTSKRGNIKLFKVDQRGNCSGRSNIYLQRDKVYNDEMLSSKRFSDCAL